MAPETATHPRASATRTGTGSGGPGPRRWTSRAVVRAVEAGSSVSCAGCGDPVKYKAKERQQQVICNVYIKGTWDRVEHFHAGCYHAAGSPHGEAEAAPTPNRRAAAGRPDAPPASAPAA